VTATAAAKNFGRLIDTIRETQIACVVERDGYPIVRISPAIADACSVRELVEWLRMLRRPGAARDAQVVVVWIILDGEQFPRFVTAYPGARS
jgi:hypothetical protein